MSIACTSAIAQGSLGPNNLQHAQNMPAVSQKKVQAPTSHKVVENEAVAGVATRVEQHCLGCGCHEGDKVHGLGDGPDPPAADWDVSDDGLG